MPNRMASSSSSTHIDSRVSRLESEVESILQSVNTLSSTISRMQDAVREDINRVTSSLNASVNDLSEKLSSRSRTNWGTIAGVATVAVMVAGLIGNLAMQPLKDQVTAQNERLDKVQDQIAINMRAIATNTERFSEISTKFEAAKSLEDLRYQMGMRHVDQLQEINTLKNKLEEQRVKRLEQAADE